MRIDRLDLAAFGPFTDVALDFSKGAEGLHVVYGPNEAGKTSALRAIRQLFEGIPHVSGDDFVHRYADMRIGARLRDRDGSVLDVVRRKKAKNPLTRPDDSPIPDAEFARFLGGVEPEEFVRKFAIDRDELVAGGKSVAEEHGDLGRLLFAAGASNLGKVGAVLKAIESDAEALYKKGGKNPKINALLAALDDVKKKTNTAALRSTEWRDHDDALHRARRRAETLSHEIAGTTRERNRLGRVSDALGPIARRSALIHELEGLRGVPRLSANFTYRRSVAEPLLQVNERAEALARAAVDELSAKVDAIDIPTDLLDQAEAIDDLNARLGVHRKNARDRDRLKAELTGFENEAKSILRDLGRDPSLADESAHESLRIKAHDRADVDDLAARREAVARATDAAEAALARHDAKLRAAAEALQSLPPERDASPVRKAILHARKRGDLDEALRLALENRARRDRQAKVGLKGLGFWTGPLDEVETLPVPLPETVERFAAERDTTQARLADVDRRLAERAAEAAENDDRVAQLRLGGDVPTAGALDDARRDRDAQWSALRARWDESQAGSFDRAIRLADDAADRLLRESTRVNTHAALLADRERIRRAVEELKRSQTQAEAERHDWQTRWSSAWRPAGVDAPGTPKEMLAWLRKHQELKEKIAEAREAADSTARVEADLITLRDGIGEALGALGQTELSNRLTLAAMIEQAEEVVDAIARETKGRDRKRLEVETLETERPALAEAVEARRAERARWQAEWAEAMGRVGLPVETPTKAAGVVIARNLALFDALAKADGHRLQVNAIEAETGRFNTDAWRLADRVAPDLVASGVKFDAEAVAAALAARLARAREARQMVESLIARRAEQEEAAANAHAEVVEKRDELARLRREAGCESDAELPGVEARAKRRDELEKELAAIDEQLLKLAAGSDLATFVDEASREDPDALRSRLDLLGEQVAALDAEKTEVNQTIGGETTLLKQWDGGSLAAESIQEAEDLRARVRSEVEQYARLRLASAVLRAGIERYREKTQGPVLHRASALFSTLTLGSFTGLRVVADDDNGGRPVLKGVRPAGEPLGVNAMSLGTADQLYLALRIATLETYLDRREPLPLVVDDVLIQFDDERASATLKILAELSRRTQVLVFTHHEHLLTLAGRAVDPDLFFPQSLPGRGRA